MSIYGSEFHYTNCEPNQPSIIMNEVKLIDVAQLGDRVLISIRHSPYGSGSKVAVPADLWLQLLRDSLKWYEGEGVASE